MQYAENCMRFTIALLFHMNQKSRITDTIISYSGQMLDFVAWMLCSGNKLLACCCLVCIYLANCRLTCATGKATLPCPKHRAHPCYLVKPFRVPVRTGNSETGISHLPLCGLKVKPVQLLSMKDYIHHPNTRPSLVLLACPLHLSIILPLT